MLLSITSICLIMSTPALVSGAVFTTKQLSDLQEFVDVTMKCKELPGLTMAVVKGNETWAKGFGVADKETGRPVTTSTLFGIGSITKSFTTAILAMLLNDTGRYTWETPVKDILGEDFQLGDDYVTNHVTLKDLLTHRTGLSTADALLFGGSPPNLTRAECEKRSRYLPVAAAFRNGFAYNNWMYTLAARVTEVMGGASWEDLLLTRILQPLGMSDTRVIGQNVEVDAENFAQPYLKVGNDVVLSDSSIYRITPMEPAGGIASSADDMAKWLKLHMRNGQTPDGAAIINEKHMRDMHTAHMLLPPEFAGGRQNFFQPQFPESAALVGYGYGWFTSVYRGRQVVSHGGSLFAYRSNLAFLPDDDVGVFVSSTGPARYLSSQQLFYYITDLLLDLDPWLNTSTVCTFPAPWNSDDQRSSPSGPSPVPGALENSDLFVGQYGNLLFGDVEILHNGTGQLSLKFQRLVANLYKTDNDSLLLAEAIGPLSFLSHVGNTTEYMRITFSDSSPRADGKYQELQMHDVARVPLTFRRDVKFSDPVPDKVKNAGGETPLWKLLSQDV